LVVKGNQPLLRQDIEDVFEASHTYLLELGLKQQDLSSERGVREVTIHGRRVEERVLRASTALCDCYNGYGDHLWPGLGQVLQAGATDEACRNGQGYRSHNHRNCLCYHRYHLPLTRARYANPTAPCLERTLAHREQAALGARCDLQRRPLHSAKWRHAPGDGSPAQHCNWSNEGVRRYKHRQSLSPLCCSSRPHPRCPWMSF